MVISQRPDHFDGPALSLFDYHDTLEEEHLQVASFYLDEPALSWYQWLYRNDHITSWSGFLQALEMRFTPSFHDDPRRALFKPM